MLDLAIRRATPDDAPLLWRMLTFAASMEGGEGDVERAKEDPNLRGYVEDYGRPGDLGVIAVRGGAPIGAAWLRLLWGEPHPSKVWTHDTPELAMGLEPAARGAGVGTRLLADLIAAAGRRYPAIALSVREDNPAVRLYERAGFVEDRCVVNRVGGVSLVMRRVLP